MKYKSYTGWVFDGWLYFEDDELIENLHYLNDIPHSYFWRSADFTEDDEIEYDCFGGNPQIHINTLGTNYIKYPHIIMDYGQDSHTMKIVDVKKEPSHYIIYSTNPYYDDDLQIKEIRIEERGDLFIIRS